MNLSLSDVRDALEIVALLGSVAALLILWWLRDKFVPKADYERDRRADRVAVVEWARKIDSNEQALTRLASRVDQLPSHDDLAGLRDKVSEIGGDVKALTKTIEGIGEQLTMLLQHHLESVPRRARP